MVDVEAEVIIIGGGPVGLTLACDLSKRDVKTIVLEKKAQTTEIIKAFALNTRSMEHFRRMGVENEIKNAAMPRDLRFNIGFYSKVIDGNINSKLQFDSWGDIEDGKINKGYPFFESGASPCIPMFCPQSASEPALKKHLENTSNCVSLCFDHEVTGLSQNEEEVIVTAKSSGITKTFKARYVVACDGGKSQTRKALGSHLIGQFEVARAVSIISNAPQVVERIKEEGKAGMAVIGNPNFLAISYFDKEKIVMHTLLPSDTPDEIVREIEENPGETFRIGFGSDLPFTVSAVSAYKMHGLLSTKIKIGRVLFAGDSAHQWLPAGGLGLNTGVADAGDLGWKLEAALKGYGGENILCSYQEERKLLVDSTRRFVLSIGGNLFGSRAAMIAQRILFSIPPIRFVMGKLIEILLFPVVFESNLLTLGFQCSNSSIIMHEYDENRMVITPRSYGGNRFPALPGCRAPHVEIEDSKSILDLFGKGFVLLIIGGDESDLTYLKEELAKRKVPLEVFVFPKLPALVAAYDRKYFLVRPDGIISWRSDSQPSQLESEKIVTTVTGSGEIKRLPYQIWNPYKSQRSHTSAFFLDLALRFGAQVILMKYYPFTPVWIAGFGVFWMLRFLRTGTQQFIQNTSRHNAVVMESSGDANDALKFDKSHTTSFGDNDVLIQVHAVSVNDIDCKMRMGFGKSLMGKVLSKSKGCSLVLGRDCSGEVVAVGDCVTKFLPGDKVFAAVPLDSQGSYTQLLAVNADCVSQMPSNIDFKEAASIPWSYCTAWRALCDAGLNQSNSRGKRILITAGTNGAGCLAIQILKSWGADVTTTCSTQNVALAHSLGADKVIDSDSSDFSAVISGFDVVIDSLGHGNKSLNVLKLFGGARYINLNSPEISYADKFGPLLGGFMFSWSYRLRVIFNRLFFGRGFYYSSPSASGACLDTAAKMIEKGDVKPVVEAVYSVDEIVAAHKHVEAGDPRGQVVVRMTY